MLKFHQFINESNDISDIQDILNIARDEEFIVKLEKNAKLKYYLIRIGNVNKWDISHNKETIRVFSEVYQRLSDISDFECQLYYIRNTVSGDPTSSSLLVKSVDDIIKLENHHIHSMVFRSPSNFDLY